MKNIIAIREPAFVVWTTVATVAADRLAGIWAAFLILGLLLANRSDRKASVYNSKA